MILADKIINERKKLGWSQEELADKLDVSRQSVSKWESAQSTPDLNRILKMAELFGVSTDYLLKDEIEVVESREVVASSYEVSESKRAVSMEEATALIETTERIAPMRATGVSLCILSPATLLTLLGLSEKGLIGEDVACAIGIVAVLTLVAIAVFIFIMNGRALKPFAFLEIDDIETAYGVDGMVREKKAKFEGKHTLFIAIGVILCILSSVPLIISGVTACIADYIGLIMVAVLLLLVATGVHLIVRVSSIMGAYDKLLQEGSYTKEEKKLSAVTGKVAGIYWPLVVGIYLAWSLWTMNWHITWIVWPVAGLLFAAILGCVKTFAKK